MKTEWISVKDRLPKYNEVVLVYDNWLPSLEPYLNTSNYNEKDGLWYDYLGDENKYSENVTHWMPLPKPPKR